MSTPALVSLLAEKGRLTDVDPSYDLTLAALLERIRTFRPSTWSYKPAPLSPLACALLGWTNTGRDRLSCVTCRQSWLVLAPSSKLWADAAGKRLMDEHATSLKSKHAPHCPWRFRGVTRANYRLEAWTSKKAAKRQLEQAASNLADVKLAANDPRTMTIRDALVKIDSSASVGSLTLAFLGWHADTPDSIAIECDYCARRALRSKYSTAVENAKEMDPFSHESFCAFVTPDETGRPGWQSRLAFLHGHDPASDLTSQAVKYKPLELRNYVDGLLGPPNVLIKRASIT